MMVVSENKEQVLTFPYKGLNIEVNKTMLEEDCFKRIGDDVIYAIAPINEFYENKGTFAIFVFDGIQDALKLYLNVFLDYCHWDEYHTIVSSPCPSKYVFECDDDESWKHEVQFYNSKCEPINIGWKLNESN